VCFVVAPTAAKGIGGSSTPDATATDTVTAAAKDEDVELAAHEPAELQAELQDELQEKALAPQEDDMDVEVAATELEGIVPTLKLALSMLNAGGECSTVLYYAQYQMQSCSTSGHSALY
jgi:predicted flavoprotein YhiN